MGTDGHFRQSYDRASITQSAQKFSNRHLIEFEKMSTKYGIGLLQGSMFEKEN